MWLWFTISLRVRWFIAVGVWINRSVMAHFVKLCCLWHFEPNNDCDIVMFYMFTYSISVSITNSIKLATPIRHLVCHCFQASLISAATKMPNKRVIQSSSKTYPATTAFIGLSDPLKDTGIAFFLPQESTKSEIKYGKAREPKGYRKLMKC